MAYGISRPIIQVKLQRGFGYSFTVSRNGVWLMLNGRMFSFSKGLNSGRWQFSVWDNYDRKSNKQLTIQKNAV